ncbi:MAG: hypothetical protein JNK23_24100 [Opitutaceae bacterium]|nr:hypothetical protein [Opitutaceae bacterium]
MKLRLFIALVLAVAARAADEPEAPRPSAREILRARVAEDAKKKGPAVKSAPVQPAAKAAPAQAPAPAPTSTKEEAPAQPIPAPANKSTTGKEPATLLPKVEVKKERLTVLDVEIAKQEEAIARERKNLKTTETDFALNDLKVAKPLAIFGGESAQFRQRVAAERVELMEAEKDILEAMKRARTREEKAELQKQLDELRTARRELDKTLR